MKILTAIYSVAFFALSSLPAIAVPGQGNTVPEPGALSLLAIGAGAAAIVWALKRNKK